MAIPSHLFEALATEGDRAPRTDAHLRALERIRTGTFGLCIDCGRRIEPERLNHTPLTEECEFCARRPAHA